MNWTRIPRGRRPSPPAAVGLRRRSTIRLGLPRPSRLRPGATFPALRQHDGTRPLFAEGLHGRRPHCPARLYATAMGVYQASINGRIVNSNSVLDPGWTDYTKRVMVQSYDVTGLLSPGKNTMGAVIGDGWYAGRLGFMGLAQYGPRPVFSAQLEILHADGSTQLIATDDSWKAGPGAIAASDPQWGEVVDARKAAPWDTAGFDDSSCAAPVLETHPIALDAQRGPPVRRLLDLKPRTITRRGAAWMVDFGQNLVGHVRLQARGGSGRPSWCATRKCSMPTARLATSFTSVKSSTGLPIVSINNARVFSVIAFSKFFGSCGSTNIVLMPNFGRMASNCVYVPPYKLFAETISSPASASVMIA